MSDLKTTETHFYRVWHGEAGTRSEMARFKAKDFDDVINYVKKEFLKPDTTVTDGFGDEYSQYLDLDVCKGCAGSANAHNRKHCCEGCETVEYIQIEQNDDIEADFKTIYGTNDFYDLTKPKGQEKADDWAPELRKAWEKNPQGGAEALLAKTVEDNPELAEGIDSKLLKRGRRVLRGEI